MIKSKFEHRTLIEKLSLSHKLNEDKKTIYIPYDRVIDSSLRKLRDVYGYSIQTEII